MKKFENEYPIMEKREDESKRIEAQHYAWVEQAGIQGTPTFFVNGYQLPKEYSIDDMIAIVPGLEDAVLKSAKDQVALQDA